MAVISAPPAGRRLAAAVRERVVARKKTPLTASSIAFRLSAAWLAIVAFAALVPRVFGSDADLKLSPSRSLSPPGDVFLLGADLYGRSMVALLAYGARAALAIGLCATATGLILGGIAGLVAGYAGGAVDMAIGRVVDVLMCFPGVLLALIITAALGPTTTNLVIAVGISMSPQFQRLVRGQVLAVRGRLFVEAARAGGAHPVRILVRHVLPSAASATLVLATLSIGVSVIAAASLSFLGLGPASGRPDWGQLLALGQPYLAQAWWISTLPGVVLTLTVIAVSLCGDALRDRQEIAR
jgi:peptide/nickel transport system permease protein